MINLKQTIKPLILAGLVGILSGCSGEREYSEIKHEEAVVTNMETHSSYSSISIIGPVISVISGSTRYETNFNGKVNFEINDEAIFNRFHMNDKVDVSFREVYSISYADLDKDGKKEVVKRELLKFEFLNAVKK